MRNTLTFAVTVTLLTAVFASSAAAKQPDIVDTAVSAGSFNTLAAALKAADLVDALKGEGPFTVFAPTDEAFAKLPEGTVEYLLKPENKQKLVGVLTYHVVAGSVPAAQAVKLTGANTLNGQRIDIAATDAGVTIDSAKVVKTDIMCSNGVIHVIDSVILPSGDNIPATATKAGKFNTLLVAAKAAGLVGALSGDGPLTVFAPTDDAFAKLPAGTIESLLKEENRGKLAAILKYHVVAGRVYSDAALKSGSAKTLQGENIHIRADKAGAKVNDATLVATDLDASNGVIHVIDTVLLPPDKAAAAEQPQHVIEAAVTKGSHLYNGGHTAECVSVYTTAATTLLESHEHGMSQHAVSALQTGLHRASNTHCADSKAWTMRHALDQAYATMTSTPQSSPVSR